MNSTDGATEEELERYRARCQSLETYLCDVQLELRRLQHLSQSTQRLLDTRSQQLAQQQTSAVALQQKLEEQLATVQLEIQQVRDALAAAQADRATLTYSLAAAQAERAILTHALEAAERDAILLRASLSWRVTRPARWLLKLLRGF